MRQYLDEIKEENDKYENFQREIQYFFIYNFK